jgi:hypothetical protein
MEVVHQACAGLDVHQKTVVACVRVIVKGKVVQEVKTFETTTQGLLALCDWLSERGVTDVAMESTGLLEAGLAHTGELVRVGARQCGPYQERCRGARRT